MAGSFCPHRRMKRLCRRWLRLLWIGLETQSDRHWYNCLVKMPDVRYDFGSLSDALTFVSLSPKLETGTVLAWKKDQTYSPAAKQFLNDIKNTL